MADVEIMTQLPRHMTSSITVADLKGNIIGRTIYRPSLIAMAFIFSK